MEITEGANCPDHNKKKLTFYCLDAHCKQRPLACVICIQKEHPKCKEELICSVEEAKEKVEVVPNETDPKLITSKLNQIMELKLYEMQKTLVNKKKAFIGAFSVDNEPKNVLNSDLLANIKKNYEFNYDEESDKVKITSKFNVSENQINESVQSFEKSLEKKILNFLDDFQKLKFYIKGQMCIEDWICHNNILIEDSEHGVRFSRKPEDQSFNYFCNLYTLPLTEPCTFKVHVEAVYESDRYVDFGIINKSKYDSTKSNLTNSFSSGSISYCGYSHGGGLTGNYPSTSASSNDGLKPGSHFYMRYEPGVIIKFYDDDNKINLSMDMTNKNEEYYLTCTVYHPQTKYQVERIE